MRETEGKLFEGNLLRLETEELLREVRVEYGKKSVKALEVRMIPGWDQAGKHCNAERNVHDKAATKPEILVARSQRSPAPPFRDGPRTAVHH